MSCPVDNGGCSRGHVLRKKMCASSVSISVSMAGSFSGDLLGRHGERHGFLHRSERYDWTGECFDHRVANILPEVTYSTNEAPMKK